jgi:cytochrome c553
MQTSVLVTALAIVTGFSVNAISEKPVTQSHGSTLQNATNNCLSCHQKNSDEVIGLFSNSTHFRRGLSCKDCHGGDGAATEKSKAHSLAFVGKPSAAQILEMCGGCHKNQLATLKASHHFHQPSREPRVDCVQCHGAHTVGKLAGDSALELTCANCHGIEYLAELPASVKQLMRLDDEIRNALRDVEAKGRKPTDESSRLRREFKHLVAEFVHATDLKNALDNAPRYFEIGNKLKNQLASLR